ncbi:hypothetical protein [Spirosoma rigui]|uniref:hypothetical protein n=1 Tax=Spirosoma rigui TaxID=564064 RepID=UPI0012D2C545|nr:hypothetical protein [Spirosoma rigui]
MFIVFAKSATCLILGLVLLVALYKRSWLENQLEKPGVPWLFLFWFVLRLLPFLGIYVLLSYEPQSDVRDYYYPIAMGAGTGKVLYRDVYCPYSPFFGYYLAVPLWLWNSTRMVVLTMTVVEALGVWLTYRANDRSESRGERLFRALFYYLLPVPFVFCVMSGQEDVSLWIFALLAGQAVAGGHSFRAGLWFGLGLLSTKAVFVLLFVPFIFLVTNKVRFLAGCIVLGLPVLIFLYWKTDLLFMTQPLEEGTYLKAPNIRSVLAPIVGEAINTLVKFENYAGLLLTMAVTLGVLLTMRTRNVRRSIALLYVLMFSLTTVVQHNAISNYAYLFMLPLVFSMLDFRDRGSCVALIVFNIGAAIHPSYWWRIGQPFYYGFSQLNQPAYWADYGLELFLVAGFAYIAFRAARALKSDMIFVEQ